MYDKFFVMIGKQCFHSAMQKIITNLPLSWPPNTYKIHLANFNSNSHILGIRDLVIRVLMNKSADV